LGCESEAGAPDLEKEGRRGPPKARKKRRLGNTENGTQRLQAERINQVWSYDFVFDQTESGGRLKWLPVLDEFTRECLSLEVERSMTSGDVIEILDELVVRRRVPEFIRSDNGPEFVANAVNIKKSDLLLMDLRAVRANEWRMKGRARSSGRSNECIANERQGLTSAAVRRMHRE
jgi:hypothetical protein